MSWIETNLTDIKSQIRLNGYLSEEINVTHVPIAEALGAAIRKNERIQGVKNSTVC